MATFNQQGQNVNVQYNAETITIGEAHNKGDFLIELRHLQEDLNKAIESDSITGESAIDAEKFVKKAVLEAEESHPNKKTLISYLTSAKDLVVTSNKIYDGLNTIINNVENCFA